MRVGIVGQGGLQKQGALLLFVLAALVPSPSRAQDETPTLEAAEAAFVAIEHERAEELARGVLEAGSNSLQNTARLYEIEAPPAS